MFCPFQSPFRFPNFRKFEEKYFDILFSIGTQSCQKYIKAKFTS